MRSSKRTGGSLICTNPFHLLRITGSFSCSRSRSYRHVSAAGPLSVYVNDTQECDVYTPYPTNSFPARATTWTPTVSSRPE